MYGRTDHRIPSLPGRAALLLCLALAALQACAGNDAVAPSLQTTDAAAGEDGAADSAPQDAAGAQPQDGLAADVPAKACSGQAQCPADTACFGGQCVAAVPCKSDKTCLALDAVCDSAAGHCVQCEDDVDCADGASCQDRVCVAPGKPCASTKECDSDQVCAKDLGQCVECVEAVDCADGLSCVDYHCQALLCQDGEATCKDLKTRQLCNGGQWIDAACPSDQVCAGGECKPQLCAPGSGQCVDGKLQTCDEAGLAWSAAVACPQGQGCVKGACAPSGCTSGQAKCAGNAVETCGADGQWKAAACPTGNTCVGADGKAQCKPLICVAGSKSCQGNAVATCDASGTAKTLDAPCPSPSVCQDGACVKPPVCEAGASSCADAKTVQLCAKDGQSFELTPCGAGKACQGGSCVASGCALNALQCAGDVVQTCDASGQWKNTKDCKQNSASCKGGACVLDPCIFGDYGCVDGTPAFCTKESGWQKQAGCPSGQICLNKGECKAKVCEAWQPFCQGDAAMICDATGTQGSLSADCAASGQVCKDGKCQAAPQVCAPGAKECLGSTLKSCNALGTAWTTTLCDDGDPCTADGCSQGQCTKVSAADGTPCSGTASGCETFACAAGKCTSQGAGIWQKSLGTPGGTGVPMRAQALPDGSVQWAGQWFAAGNSTATAWLARSSASGSLSANWPISGNVAYYATAWTPEGTWIGRGGEVLLIGNTGGAEQQVQLPAAAGMGWPSVTALAAHPQGGAVVLLGSAGVGGGYISEVVRVSASGGVQWRSKSPVAVSSGLLSVLKGGEIRLLGNAAGSSPAPSYHQLFSADGAAGTYSKLALTTWPAWADLQAVVDPQSGDWLVVGRTHKPCSGCSSEWQELGAARIAPDGKVIWQSHLINPQGAEEQLGGLWIDGDNLVVVSSLGDSKLSGWTWTRLRLVDGKALSSKSWTVSGGWGGFVPVAAPSGSGALVALRHTYGYSALSPLFRVDAWGNPACSESAGCASKTYAGCDDANPCTAENCLAGVCLHVALPDGLSCGAGKACSGGKCL